MCLLFFCCKFAQTFFIKHVITDDSIKFSKVSSYLFIFSFKADDLSIVLQFYVVIVYMFLSVYILRVSFQQNEINYF